MRQRPFALSFFSAVMLLVALSLPVQAIVIQNFADLFQSLTLLNIVVMVLCASTALSAFKVHKSFRHLLTLTIAAVIFNNWWVGHVGLNFSLLETSAASFAFILLCGVLLEPNTYRVLTNPKLKWWEVPVRAKTEIPVSLIPVRGEALTKTSFDISETGIFLQGLAEDELQRLNVGEKFGVCLHFSRIVKVRCTARIVRKAEAKGSYPPGIGLQFEETDSEIKDAIRRLSLEGRQQSLAA